MPNHVREKEFWIEHARAKAILATRQRAALSHAQVLDQAMGGLVSLIMENRALTRAQLGVLETISRQVLEQLQAAVVLRQELDLLESLTDLAVAVPSPDAPA